MGKASNKTVDNNPSLDYEVFGFNESGGDVNIKLSAIKDLIESSLSGVTNNFVLSNTTISDGSFTSDSLDFDSVTTLTFNNKNTLGLSLLDFFQLLDNNKDDLLLKINEVGFEINAIYKISNVIYSNDDVTVLSVSKYSNFKRDSFKLGGVYTISLDVETDRFSDTQADRLKDIVYENIVQSISVSPTSFEKGVETDLTFTWKVTKNDDTLNTVTVDGVDKLNEATGVNRTYTVNNQVNSKSVSLVTAYTRNNTTGGSGSVTNSATSTARIPQYFGLVADGNVPPLTYALLNPADTTKLKKFLSSSNVKTVVLGTDLPTPSNEKLFFLSTNANAVIRDGNNFVVTSAFTKSTVTMELDNGTQSITQYLLIDPVNSAGTYTITNS